MPHSEELIKLVKYIITGIANTLVDYLLFALLASVFGLNIYFSQLCSYSAGMCNSYLINRSWTFHSKQNFFSIQIVKFILANLFILALSMLLLRIFTNLLFPILLAKLITVAITLFVNFILNRLWVFR